MQYPFKIIESRIEDRNQFKMTIGTQPTHALFYLKKGNFSMEIDGINQEIREGDCVIFPDYIPFKRSVKNRITFVYIKFSMKDFISYGCSLPYGKIEFINIKRFKNTIAELEKHIDDVDKFNVAYKNHLLCDIIMQIVSENTAHLTNNDYSVQNDALLLKASDYIEKNISGKISIQEICRYCGTNTSTLNYRFRKITGLSTWQFINALRMKKARKLLLTTTYSIKEISVKCGFDEVYYFSNSFKKYHKISPSHFRNN